MMRVPSRIVAALLAALAPAVRASLGLPAPISRQATLGVAAFRPGNALLPDFAGLTAAKAACAAVGLRFGEGVRLGINAGCTARSSPVPSREYSRRRMVATQTDGFSTCC